MRNILRLPACILAGVTLLLSACGKDDVVPAQNPFSTFLAAGSTAIKVYDQNTNSYEVGYGFKSSIAGKIVQLGTHMPKAGTYQVTLWDVQTEKSIAQAMVTQSEDGESASTSISGVTISAEKEYRLTVNCNKSPYYELYTKSSETRQSSASSDLLPITVGNFTFLYETHSIASSVFPTTTYKDKVYGYPEFGIRF